MKTSFEVAVEFREEQGKGASRRLRHEGKVPAIIYGGNKEPRALSLNHNKLTQLLDNEKFYTSIVALKIGEQTQNAVVRDLQRHPYKPQIVHIDFQRVLDDEPIRMEVPLHFVGAETCPGVKTQGGSLSHLKNQLAITCLPKDLPEYISVDCSAMSTGDSIHIADLNLPEGVKSVDLEHGRNDTVVAIHGKRGEEEEAAPAADAKKAPAGKAAPAKAAPAGKAAPAKAAAPAAKKK